MHIGPGAVVRLDYDLKNEAGEALDSSAGESFEYLHGHGQLVPGLERQLEGRQAGERLRIVVEPNEAYGEHDPTQVQDVPRHLLPEAMQLEVGLELSSEGPQGEAVTLWIRAVDVDHVTLDANHPLAGTTLYFQIVIHDVRAATASELACGHPHTGPDQLH